MQGLFSSKLRRVHSALSLFAFAAVIGCQSTPPPTVSIIEEPASPGFLYKEDPRMIWPVDGPVISHFGKRHGRAHQGVDIKAPMGTPIRAALAGVVVSSSWQHGYGLTVVVKHPAGKTLYAHLQRSLVKRGNAVRQGQLIGRVGKTGNAEGAHLHFESRDQAGNLQDPMTTLAQRATSDTRAIN